MRKEISLYTVSNYLKEVFGGDEGSIVEKFVFVYNDNDKDQWRIHPIEFSIQWKTNYSNNKIIIRLHCKDQKDFDYVEKNIKSVISTFKGIIEFKRENEKI